MKSLNFPYRFLEKCTRLRSSISNKGFDSYILVGYNFHSGRRIEAGDLIPVYKILERLGKIKNLTIFLNALGGDLTTAFDFARIVKNYCDSLQVILCFRANSASALLCTAADEVVFGPLSRIGQMDPLTRGEPSTSHPGGAVSSRDVAKFKEMALSWFGIEDSPENSIRLLEILSRAVLPLELSKLFRAEEYCASAVQHLVSLRGNLAHKDAVSISNAQVEALVARSKCHSHGLDCAEAKNSGFPAITAVGEKLALLEEIHEFLENCFLYPSNEVSGEAFAAHAILLSNIDIFRYDVRLKNQGSHAPDKNSDASYSITDHATFGMWRRVENYE